MERSIENMVTLPGLPFNSTLQKLDIYFAKQWLMLSFLILQSDHTWANGTGHSSVGERRTTFAKTYGMEVRCY
jgi:hypothetical protein